MENNDCGILFTKKSEFKNVLLHILNASNRGSYDDLNMSGTSTFDRIGQKRLARQRVEILQTPRTIKATEFAGRKLRGYVKRDSFYYLQRALEQRVGISKQVIHDDSQSKMHERNL